jgi:dihydrofolate synthase/folylpolyglutamate synthase
MSDIPAPSAAHLAALRKLHAQRMDPSTLARMNRLLAALGHPEPRLPPVVHVAGTNAKGSLIAFLQTMLEASGRRVHSYQSPPLQRISECIRVAGVAGDHAAEISEARFAGVLARVLAANGDAPLTSFEGETAAALLAFAETPADIVLLETGLGGRTDATNVIAHPLLTVLTPIDIDHAEFLGAALADIAGEKAGILKRGTPCIVARQPVEALERIRQVARDVSAPLFEHGQDWDSYEQHGRLVYQDESGLLDLPPPSLVGRHQVDNAGLAVATALRLGALKPDEAAIARGLTSTRWPGRLQRLSQQGLAAVLPATSELWVDGGHNAAAAAVIAQAMAEMEERSAKPLHLVLGMMKSKRLEAFLKPFGGLARSVTGIVPPDVSRAYTEPYSAAEIAETAQKLGVYARPAASLEDGLAAIAVRANAKPVRVLVCGSLHLAGSTLAADAAALAASKRTGLAGGG